MRAIIARDRAAGIGGLSLAEVSHPHAAENDVIVRVHAAGFTQGSLTGRERGPTALGATGARPFPGTNCPESLPSWVTAPQG